MKCPYCNYKETKVTDSRESKDGSTIKRRRECSNCKKRFSTLEKILKLDLEVRKSNQDIEEFNLGKIKKSIMKAVEKRPITLEQIEHLLNEILEDIKKVDKNPIHTEDIGLIVLKNLKKLDEMAFLKFAIVHRNYSNMSEFISELTNLKNFEEFYKK
jgi:transcriptional repressor NrdR